MVVSKKEKHARCNVYFSALVINLSATAATCVLSWSSPTLPIITHPGAKIYVNTEEGAWISSLPALGAAFGPFITGRIVDNIGRKYTLMAFMGILTISWICMYLYEELFVLYVFRFIAGLGVGCVYATMPMYVAEIAPVELRGMLCALLQFFDCIGYLIEYIVGAYVSYENLILVSGTISILSFLAFMLIPESPYHLNNKGNEKEALQALQYFRGYAEISTLEREITDMKASATNMEMHKGSFRALFSTKGNLRCLYYSLGLMFFQQMSGINIVTFYSKTIFQESGSSFSANLSSIIVAVVMTFASILTITAAKIFRVKDLLCFSALGEIFSMFTLGTYFYLKHHYEVKFLDWLPVTSLVLFIFTYTLGFGPLVWVVTSEIYPSHLKALGCGLSASFCWFLCFLLTRFFAPFTEAYGKEIAFWGFGAFCILALLFVIYELPDTHRKTFQEIQDMIQGNAMVSFEQQEMDENIVVYMKQKDEIDLSSP